MFSINPIAALIIFAIFVLFIILLFWPKLGIIARYNKIRRNTKRVLMEDALKHLYDYESHKLNATLNSIAGNLNISADKSSKIVKHLKNLNLVDLDDQLINLTNDGRSYALRVIRIHRLWENYLAEETGVKELDWHDEAEEVEHVMTQADADALSAKMGNPKFDPHGDPIPTTEGEILPIETKLLNTVKKNSVVKIKHVEDEPKSIYSELLNNGLYPGKEMLVLDKTKDKIKVAVDGEEKYFEPLIASKVSVEILEEKNFINEKIRTLIDLKNDEYGEVINVAPNCRGQQRRRLLDFGIVPGAQISIHMNSPLKDPTAYLVKDTIVALRENQANKVIIKIS